MIDRYNSFTTLIININRYIFKIKNEEMKTMNLKSHHVSCIYYLYTHQNDNITFKELYTKCALDKGMASKIINYLVKNNLVIYNYCGKKAYNDPIILTDKGLNIGIFISNKIDEILAKANVGIDEEKRNIMYECLTKLCTNLNNITKEYKE